LSEKFAIVYNSTSTNTGQHPCTFATWSGSTKTVLAYVVHLTESFAFLNTLIKLNYPYVLLFLMFLLLPVLQLRPTVCCVYCHLTIFYDATVDNLSMLLISSTCWCITC